MDSAAPPSLDGQVAIVTGGGGGIGRAIAISFARAGADVVIADSEPERCQEAAERIRELGRTALSFPTDVRHTDQVYAMVETAAAQFGRIDILVNNAGGTARKPFLEQSERSWRRHIDLNLVSMLAATSAAVPHIIAGGRGGSIINISSIEATRAAPNYAVYAACKAGMLNFTRSMALELADHHIRVNAITPDYIVTPGLRGNFSGPVDPATWHTPSAAEERATGRRIPAGRAGQPEDCAAAALFLASGMSAYVNGVTLPVDGGTWASGGWLRDTDGNWTLSGDA